MTAPTATRQRRWPTYPERRAALPAGAEAQLRAMRDHGEPPEAIAAALGCTLAFTLWLLRQQRVVRGDRGGRTHQVARQYNRRQRDRVRDTRIRDVFLAGVAVAEIATREGLTPQRVTQLLTREFGAPLRVVRQLHGLPRFGARTRETPHA